MRVRCTSVVQPATGQIVTASDWITLGQEYLALAVSILGEGTRFRILADDGETPVIWPGEHFEVVDARIPGGWSIRIDPGGVELGPEALIAQGYWERFFDADPDATHAFRKAVEESAL